MTIETDILDAIKTKVEAVSGIAFVSHDKIRIKASDFRMGELPAVQVYDVGQSIQHQQGRSLVNWTLILELIMKADGSGLVDQNALLTKRREIGLALWDAPNLGIPGVTHLIYTGNATDLHMLTPLYTASMEFQVQFYDDLVGSC